MSTEGIHDPASLILLTFDGNGEIVGFNAAAEALLGCRERQSIDELADTTSTRLLRDLAADPDGGAPPPSPCMLTFLGRNGARLAAAAVVDRARLASGAPSLRITAIPTPGLQRWVRELVESEALLRNFAKLSSEAMWCIEFSEAVDLTLGDHEIIRQVFENECHWRLCNESMARIYDLPPGLDFNKQPVSHYFQRNPENEAFVRQIIESNFAVDDVLSIDTRHDGSSIYIENTVRSDIVDGRLLRLWGTVRDITQYRQTHNRLVEAARDVSSILCALPDAILVINRNRTVLAVNPAFESLLGWASHQLLGQDIQPIIDLEAPLPGGRRWYGISRQRWIAEVRMPAGASMRCDIQSAPIGEEAPERFVLSLRPLLATAPPTPTRAP